MKLLIQKERKAVSPAIATLLLIAITVFGAGITLSFIDWRTGRVSPSIIAHVINNLL